MSHSPIILSIACADQESAKAIGAKLVEAKLVACAQVFPIHSIFRWEGKVQSEAEVMLQAKTLEKHVTAIEKLVVEQHSYEVPEIIATPIVWGHQSYLDWMKAETR
ncbi:MAG: divalent-cation tolerance protein CutA [Bacteroidota bacterium]